MSTVSVETQRLSDQAKVYLEVSQGFYDLMRKARNTNREMETHWQGKAHMSYLQQFEQLAGGVDKMRQLLMDINKQVVKYAQTVAERDQQDARGFGLM